MKVLITGISGRVGANLAYQLMKRGDTIRGLIFPGDPKTEKVQKLGVEVYEADMNDADGVYRACDGVDAIVHLAAQMKQGNSTVQRMVEINSFGTLNVLEGALRSSTKIRSILLAGTDQAYGVGRKAFQLAADRQQYPLHAAAREQEGRAHEQRKNGNELPCHPDSLRERVTLSARPYSARMTNDAVKRENRGLNATCFAQRPSALATMGARRLATTV